MLTGSPHKLQSDCLISSFPTAMIQTRSTQAHHLNIANGPFAQCTGYGRVKKRKLKNPYMPAYVLSSTATEKKVHNTILLYELSVRSTVLKFLVGHLHALHRFANFSPADCSYQLVRVVLTKTRVIFEWLWPNCAVLCVHLWYSFWINLQQIFCFYFYSTSVFMWSC